MPEVVLDIKGVKCPSCGDAVPIKAGQVLAQCQSCGSVYRVEGLLGTPRFVVPHAVEEEQARSILAKFFKKFGIRGDFKRGVRQGEARLIYVPLWYMDGRVMGWRLGYVERRDSEGRVHREYKELMVDDRLWWSEPATGVGELNITGANPRGLPLRVYREAERPEGAEFLEITEEEEVNRERGLEGLKSYARVRHPLDVVTDEYLTVADTDFFLVYYPFWQINYSYKNLKYSATVDAARGKLVYARAPKAIGARIWPFTLGLVFGNLALGIFAWVGIDWAEEGKVVIAAIVGWIALCAFLARKLKTGGEVVVEE